MFVLRKTLSLAERAVVDEIRKGVGGSAVFGSEKRWIKVEFIPDGVNDIVLVKRSDGSTGEGVVERTNEAAIVSVLEQVKAQAFAWAEGAN